MLPKITLHLRDDITVQMAEGGGIELYDGARALPLKKASPGAVKALLRLSAGGATKEELEETARDGWSLPDFPVYFEKLSRLGYITWSVEENSQCIARLTPMGLGFEMRLPEITPGRQFLLSRFAYSRRLENKTVLETPLEPVRVELVGWLGAAIWGLLSCPLDLAEIIKALPGADPKAVKLLLQLFCAAGVIQKVDAGNCSAPEDSNQALRQWEFHDLLFHSRTRYGRHNYPIGATYLFQAEIPALPGRRRLPHIGNLPGCR